VDLKTKKRQLIATVIALTSLLMTIGMAFFDQYWRAATLTSYIVLVSYIWWGNRHVYLVTYRNSDGAA
jgi:hypothetical protein